MAKLQQKMETTKQNSQILLIGGYVTMNGKRYDECVPFEKEAFNEALRDSLNPLKCDFETLLQGLVSPLLLQYDMKEDEEETIPTAIFNQLKGALKPEKYNTPEGWWYLKATCGCYTMRLSGNYYQGELETEAEIYKVVGKQTIYLNTTDDQWATLVGEIENEYERLIEERREDERNRCDERASHDLGIFITL